MDSNINNIAEQFTKLLLDIPVYFTIRKQSELFSERIMQINSNHQFVSLLVLLRSI